MPIGKRKVTMMETKRIRVYPAGREQMESILANEQNVELKKAYGEMLEGSLSHPEDKDWYAMWIIEKTDGTQIGDLCFKGIEPNMNPEIGYGIMEGFRGCGYASEAVGLALQWAFRHSGVTAVEAETDPGNIASQRVLTKCGFRPMGITGEEGPRFIVYKDSMINVVFKNYTEQDYEAVCDFLIELNRNNSHINWNWARFEWMAEHPEFDKSLISSIGLWLDNERIVGAAIYDMYFGEAFCGVLPGYEALYSEILNYADRELRDEHGLGVSICDDDSVKIKMTQAQGFAKDEQTETVMSMELDKTLSIQLSDGYSFALLDPVKEPYAFQWLLWQGFDHGTDRSEFEQTEEIIPQLRRHFDPRLSVAAVDRFGEYAAYCCVWYHPKTDYAYVEPVCTVPGHRGKGLAKAVIYEALNRAASLEAKKAYVISDSGFYEKIGFRKDRHFTFYRKG